MDIILSNEEGLVQNLTYLPPLGNSDHLVLKFDLTCYTLATDRDEQRLNLNKGNYEQLNSLIGQAGWENLHWTDIEADYCSFKDTLAHLTIKCIPKVCPKKKRSNIFMTREAMMLKNRKRRLWMEYTRSRDDISFARYVRCRNDLRRLTRNLRRNFEQRLVDNLKDNPKSFWRYVSSRTKSRSGVENLRSEDGELTTNDSEKAEALNRFYTAVCTIEPDDPGDGSDAAVEHAGHRITDVDISVDMVKKQLSTLKVSSAAGPDGIHPRILRETAETVSLPLARMFRKS